MNPVIQEAISNSMAADAAQAEASAPEKGTASPETSKEESTDETKLIPNTAYIEEEPEPSSDDTENEEETEPEGKGEEQKGEETPEEGTEEEEPAEKTYKLKVNGKELEYPESKVIEFAQKVAAANEMFEEASATKKEFATFMNNFKDDPLGIAEKLGINTEEVVKAYIKRKAEYEAMTPAQKEMLKVQQEKEKLEAEKQQMAQSKQEADYNAEYNKQLAYWANEIKVAIESDKEITPSKELTRDVVGTIREYRRMGYDITAKQALEAVKAKIKAMAKVESSVKKTAKPVPNSKVVDTPDKNKGKPKQKLSVHEWRNKIRSLSK